MRVNKKRAGGKLLPCALLSHLLSPTSWTDDPCTRFLPQPRKVRFVPQQQQRAAADPCTNTVSIPMCDTLNGAITAHYRSVSLCVHPVSQLLNTSKSTSCVLLAPAASPPPPTPPPPPPAPPALSLSVAEGSGAIKRGYSPWI